DAMRGLTILADDEEIIATLRAERCRCGIFDRHGLPKPGESLRGRHVRPGRGQKSLMEERILSHIGRDVALKDDLLLGWGSASEPSQLLDLSEILLTAVVVQPHDLKWIVPFNQAVGIV